MENLMFPRRRKRYYNELRDVCRLGFCSFTKVSKKIIVEERKKGKGLGKKKFMVFKKHTFFVRQF